MHWIAAVILYTIVLISAANRPEADMNDTALSDKIAHFTAASTEGATLRLDEMTDFQWDTVRAFSGTASLEYYRHFLGPDFNLDDSVTSQTTDDTAILVFQDKGAVVRITVLRPTVYLSDGLGIARERQRTALRVTSRGPGPYGAIEFVE